MRLWFTYKFQMIIRRWEIERGLQAMLCAQQHSLKCKIFAVQSAVSWGICSATAIHLEDSTAENHIRARWVGLAQRFCASIPLQQEQISHSTTTTTILRCKFPLSLFDPLVIFPLLLNVLRSAAVMRTNTVPDKCFSRFSAHQLNRQPFDSDKFRYNSNLKSTKVSRRTHVTNFFLKSAPEICCLCLLILSAKTYIIVGRWS